MNYSPKIDPSGEFAGSLSTDLSALGQIIGWVNVANGWDTGRDMIANPDKYDPKWKTTHLIAELGLIMTEASEGVEEVRNGRAPNEAYYSKSNVSPYDERESHNPDGTPRKPNGLPSELADVIIRALDIADTHKIDLGAAVIEKLNHNATRGHRHGGKTL